MTSYKGVSNVFLAGISVLDQSFCKISMTSEWLRVRSHHCPLNKLKCKYSHQLQTDLLASKVLHDFYHSPAGGVDDISSALVLLRGKNFIYLERQRIWNAWQPVTQTGPKFFCWLLLLAELTRARTIKEQNSQIVLHILSLNSGRRFLVNSYQSRFGKSLTCLVNKWCTPLTYWPSSPESLFLKTWAPLDSAHYSR